MTATLEDEHLRLLSLEIHPVSMENAAMNHEIVAFAVRKISVNGLQNAGALADVHQLVALRVPVEMLVVLRRARRTASPRPD